MLSPSIRTAVVALGAALSLLVAGEASADWGALNLPQGVTPISHIVYDLHMLILWICVIIGIVVFGAMFISMVLHRKAAGHEPAQFHHSTFAEILWTVVPILILVGMAIPATKTLVAMEDTSDADLTIKVTGYQWMWKYDYLEDEVTFYSNLASTSRAAIYEDPWEVENYLLEVDNPVVLPVGKKVRILLTADDVIHAWWVPDLGQKKDAIPGFINEIWVKIEEPGTYRGQCAELCGKDHGFMPIVVEAKSEAEYKQWVAAYKAERSTRLAAAQSPGDTQ
jgi:cytochrome c oxidase subunit 2